MKSTAMTSPNFLIIQADQMAASALSAYGNSFTKMPHIDALGAAGTVFLNTYCAFPLCGPSRASMMTGKLPSTIRAYDNAAELSSEIPTLRTTSGPWLPDQPQRQDAFCRRRPAARV